MDEDREMNMKAMDYELEDYFERHNLRNLLHEIGKILGKEKPENPIEFLSKLFTKAQMSGIDVSAEGFTLELLQENADS
ncbi:MAG: EF-hand calcium-binding domain-containing protein 10 [Marteilia pararefringens]